MNAREGTGSSRNTATGSAHVGVQAQAVHGDVTVYQLGSDDTPRRRFEIGVHYLDGGMPEEARTRISEAVAADYVDNEVLFHLLLSILSGRTLQQLSERDMEQLHAVRGRFDPAAPGAWTDGTRIIIRLLDQLELPAPDVDTVIKEFDQLAPEQRERIAQHLEMFLGGQLEDHLWRVAVEQARAGRRRGDRAVRAWKFFQAKPKRPVPASVRPVATGVTDHLRAAAATVAFVVAGAYLGWQVVRRDQLIGVPVYLAAVALGVLCIVNGAEWRIRAVRLHTRDREHGAFERRPGPLVLDAFGHHVASLLDQYFTKYVPAGTKRDAWLAGTAGVRRMIWTELVGTYRAQKIRAERIAWLARYLVRDVRTRWLDGTLLGYRALYRTPATTKAACLLLFAADLAAGEWVVDQAVREQPLVSSVAAAVLAGAGWSGARWWLRVAVERRRFAEETDERDRNQETRMVEFQRWKKRLEDKPSDAEMAAWLDCDRRLLTEYAMRHHRLIPHDVIAHAFLEGPAQGTDYRRARVKRGAWRYSRYQLLLFLVSNEGLRLLTAELEFGTGAVSHQQRNGYPFDAVAAVQVTVGGGAERTFELALVNGDRVEMPLIESGAIELQQGERARTLSHLSQDAAGLGTTLHVLEGIAVEGRRWTEYERQRGARRIDEFRTALHQLLDQTGTG